MALGPISNLGAPPPQPSPARDVTNAQRAFFQAALGQSASVTQAAAVEPPRTQAAPVVAPEPAKPAAQVEAPRATYRPGSLLDVRI